jgi:DNA-binding transcriptional LysR family regulator
VVGNFPDPPRRPDSELLYHEGFVCALRAGHPALARGFDLDAYLRCSHLNVSLRGEPSGYVDRVLARSRRRRRVALTAGHFLVAADIAAATDLVATEPVRVLGPAAARLGLELRAAPFRIPAFEVGQMWPRRLNADLGHAWLRAQVKASATPGATTALLEASDYDPDRPPAH